MYPLYLFHAATRDRHDFEPFLGHINGTEAAAMDLLGHGDAPRAPRYRIIDIADEIALNDEPVLLYGHSLGGMVALVLAARHPDLVKGLVLEDPPLFESRQPRLDTTHWGDGFRKLKSLMTGRGADWSEDDWRTAVSRWPSGHGSTSIEDAGGAAATHRRARQIAKLDPAVLDGMVATDCHDDFEVMPSLRAAKCPVAIIAGGREKGSALSEEDVRILAGEPNVTIVSAPAEGHYVRERRPDLCAKALHIVGGV